MKKVYVIAIKESELLCSTFECYDSFELAKGSIYKSVKAFPNRKILETNLRNEFDIVDNNCVHVHTLKIIDLWLRTK